MTIFNDDDRHRILGLSTMILMLGMSDALDKLARAYSLCWCGHLLRTETREDLRNFRELVFAYKDQQFNLRQSPLCVHEQDTPCTLFQSNLLTDNYQVITRSCSVIVNGCELS